MRKSRILLIVAVCALGIGTTAGAKEVFEQHYAVMLDGMKIGWGKYTRVVDGNQVITAWDVLVSVLRRGRLMGGESQEIHTETSDGKPLVFTYRKLLGNALDQCKGDAGGQGVFHVTGVSGGSMWSTDIDWPKGAMLFESIRKVMQEKGLAEGTEYSVTVFVPLVFQAAEMKVQVGPKKEIDILGTPVSLTEVRQTTVTKLGTREVISYVDDDLVPVKRIVSEFDLKLELVAAEKSQDVRSTADATTWLRKCAWASPAPLGGAAAAKPIIYELEYTGSKRPVIPNTGSQTVSKADKKSVVVKVLPAVPSAGTTFPYEGEDRAAKKAMKSNRYLQSEDDKVVALARKAIGKATDAAEAARSIEAFVRKYLKKQPISLTYERAGEVLEKKEGDCTEFALLTAAMCRAVGIPARTVYGVVYQKEFGGGKDLFVPHMWVEAYVGNAWFGLDATTEACDARRIALSVGDGQSSRFTGMLDMLGGVKITTVTLPQKGKD